jgi:3-keto-5-aminohexanoate cleavage enzyme
MALVDGGGVRIGLEDNIWYNESRSRLATNRDLIERILVIARALGRVPYTHKEARALLLGSGGK